jgi:pimeloyl-ACP methyl ester carboxylesterase
MKEVEDANIASKQEGDKILQKYEKVSPVSSRHDDVAERKVMIPSCTHAQALPTRQFLLTNTMTKPDKTLGFRIPLDILSSSIPAIGNFPYFPGQVTWEGPTLFVKGEHSKYINRRNLPDCKAFFPNMKLETLDAGHWVHAERPTEYVDIVTRFIQSA